MDYAGKLERLGWTRKQAEVYLALLQLGPSTAYQVAKKSGHKRPTVYVLLDELRRMDAVLIAPEARRQVYTARPPQALVNKAAEELNDLIGALSAIDALAKKPGKPIVHYFEGLQGVREALDYDLERTKDDEIVGFYAYDDELSPVLLRTIDEHNDKLRMNRTKLRGIVPDHPSLVKHRANDKAYGRSMKTIAFDRYKAGNSLDIGPDFVRLIAFRDLQAVVVENKQVAENVRQIFEMLWQELE